MTPEIKQALSWWNKQTEEFKNKVDWPLIMRGEKFNHCIVVLYNKSIKP